MTAIWLPFGFRPKKKTPETGPYYADIQARGLAASIDVALLFFLFQRPFDALTHRIYTAINPDLLAKARAATDTRAILQLLWQSHLPQLWLMNTTIQIFILGVVIVGVQCWLRTTPGKWLLGLRIVRADTLKPVARWQYPLRFLAYIPACLPLMIGVFWMSFNKRHRGWHDIMVGTVVLHTHSPGWTWQLVKRAYRWLRNRYASKPL